MQPVTGSSAGAPIARDVALIARDHGDPFAVIAAVDDPPRAPGPGEVQVRLRAAPINPADLNLIAGTYGVKPTPPFACGLEGVGEVVARGAGVEDLAPGDRVRPVDGLGSWRTHVTADADRFHRLPPLHDLEQAAMLAVNPATAWRLLHDWPRDAAPVLINGGSTTLGRCLIQIGAVLGIPIIATVRDAARIPDLLRLGARAAVVEGRDALTALRAAGPAPLLAINQVGGESAGTQLRALREGGTQVTVGGLSLQPIAVGAGPLIFKDLAVQGFWITRWYREAPAAERNRMLAALGRLVDEHRLHQSVAARFPLAQWREALAAAMAPRSGKILLTC